MAHVFQPSVVKLTADTMVVLSASLASADPAACVTAVLVWPVLRYAGCMLACL